MPTLSLKEHRERAFLTTRELAEKAGVSPVTIWRIEGAKEQKRQPRIVRAISNALGVQPSEITEFLPANYSTSNKVP